MSVDFRPSNPINDDDRINLANGNAGRVLDFMGLKAELCGECEAGTLVYICNRTLDRAFSGNSREGREGLVYLVLKLAELRLMAYDAYTRDAEAVIHWS